MSDSDLQTLSPTGVAPKTVIKDGASAHAIKSRFIKADIGRSAQRAQLKAMYDGHPPADPAELRKKGIGEASNVNMKRMCAAVNLQTDADLDAQFENSSLAQVIVEFGRGTKGHDFSQIITDNLNRTLSRWEGYYDVCAKSDFNRNFYGIGSKYFEDDINWRPLAADAGQVYFDRDADTDISKNDMLLIRRTWRLHELYRKIEDPDLATKRGWDVVATQKAIVWAAQQTNGDKEKYSNRVWEAWNQRIKGNDLYWSCISPGIVLYDLLATEYDGSISRRLLTENDSDDMLFVQLNAAKNLRQTICPFFLTKQESLVHSIRGLGAQLFNVLKMLDKIDNRIFDMTLIGGSIVIQPKTSGARDKLNALHLGPVTVLPADVNYIQSVFPTLSQGGIITHNMLMQTVSQTTGEYNQSAQSTQSGEAPTATQSSNDLAMLARRSSSQRNQLFIEKDNELLQMFRRLANPNLPDKCTARGQSEWCKEARDFQKRVLDAGVPLSALQEPYLQSVSAVRPIGSGSVLEREQKGNKILSLLPIIPNQQAQYLMKKDALTAFFGKTIADRYMPAIPGKQLVDTAKVAQLENAGMQDGHSFDVMDYENAVIHLGIHLPMLMQMTQALTQASSDAGQTADMSAAAKVYGVLSIGLPHCSAHLQTIASDPTNKEGVEAVVNIMRKLNATANHLQFQLKSAASAQQREQINQSQQQTADAQKMQLEAAKLQLATRKQAHKESVDSQKLSLQLAEATQRYHLNNLDAFLNVKAATEPTNDPAPSVQ